MLAAVLIIAMFHLNCGDIRTTSESGGEPEPLTRVGFTN
jgi:hypothetical protein